MNIQWNRPELVIIEHGEPAESVLQTCKTNGPASGPVTFHHEGCAKAANNCGACSSRSSS
jgi:hypothetical protein